MTANKKRKRNNKKKVTFDEEIITKNAAANILKNVKEIVESAEEPKVIKSKKRKNDINVNNQQGKADEHILKTKVKKRNANKPQEEDKQDDAIDELDPSKPEIKKVESIRERKRRKHSELLAQKRQKIDENMQKQCLNYISKWKHARDSWKFEKLKQIWLQKHVFNELLVPNAMWINVLEYLNASKGKIREMLLKDALKIVEEVDGATKEDGVGEEIKSKYHRAREIVQNLQE